VKVEEKGDDGGSLKMGATLEVQGKNRRKNNLSNQTRISVSSAR
jgi:hypothetical protein